MALDILVDLDDLAPSDASLSRKSDHRPANDSFRPLPSKVSAISDGVLGVRCHGDIGVLRFGFDAPGLASPACSRCSSDQPKRAAIMVRIWNFLGSDRSSARKCRM